MPKGPVVLISMDGVGIAPPGMGNAVASANTPNLDKYWQNYPHTYLEASGLSVGVPAGEDGNSEVGHMIMGAGKVIFQELPRIDIAIKNNSFFQNSVIKEAFQHISKTGGNLHLMGLVGSGYVHSSMEHLKALIQYAKQENVGGDKVLIHAFTDGRDSGIHAAKEILEELEMFCSIEKYGKIVSIIGRAYAMDRNRNWKRTKLAYDLLTEGKGDKYSDWRSALDANYSNNLSDEYVKPSLIEEGAKIKEGDSVIFFNFRPDRAYQLTYAFESPKFTHWKRKSIKDLFFVGMTEYENGYPTKKAFPAEVVTTPIGKVLSEAGLTQFRIAESEKFPHVTYFFNGKNLKPYSKETWKEIPSPKVTTYDKKPEMSQEKMTDELIKQMKSRDFDFILVNFAGPDMVGHTGKIDATIKAMESCDECIGKIVNVVLEKEGSIFITADHGNAEEMINSITKAVDTKHSTNFVPFIFINNEVKAKELGTGSLSDIAPTILKHMKLEIPEVMTGHDLLNEI